jgi:hypothetical protein
MHAVALPELDGLRCAAHIVTSNMGSAVGGCAVHRVGQIMNGAEHI